ncbi:glycoside hydrolase family 35 protein [Lacisediminihabitans profunda]|uniref:Beta-galactosidase n=1 Tax=Lacisediminihabitans profunda TaxID=2594790 RepID=A0A5C8UQW1_9MICO|nr:beta-galactosidase family protein [Lacisediminihabitans profunda]TXN30974.1 beta-galactosidase [Lacisediminihabitans profunda]
MDRFEIEDDDFVLNGEPFRILSGAIHYFRVHPDQWADRIHKARLMGLNTIETYVSWNFHAETPDSWTQSGRADLDRFLRLIQAEGMYAIVRPGPYICAEWDNGGLPAWLFANPTVGIRRDEPQFIAAVTTYLNRVLGIVAPLQIGNGGPVILVQVENEYGAYGDDASYLRKLTDITRSAGITVPLTTVDQPQDDMLANGSLPELLKTGSFGSRAVERLETLRKNQPTGPLMCSEFWDGWFDHWGAHHHTTSAGESAAELDALLSAGASVNIYMFHGGTNFGFTNGANDKGVYQPIVTSYDYDAPLDEAGQPTAKYWAFREVLARHSSLPAELPAARVPAPDFSVPLDRAVSLFSVADRLGSWSWSDGLPSMDELGQYSGFALYSHEIDLDRVAVLEIGEVRDRAYVFVNDSPIGVLARDHHDRSISVPAGRGTLSLLVEDQGRVDYGDRIGEPKGLIGPTVLDGVRLQRWGVLPLDLRSLAPVDAALDAGADHPRSLSGPVFARGHFSLAAVQDLFLDTSSWGKGVVWINGFCLGRYWSRGPQRTLYVPAPVLNRDRNEMVVLELESAACAEARFVTEANLGHTEF